MSGSDAGLFGAGFADDFVSGRGGARGLLAWQGGGALDGIVASRPARTAVWDADETAELESFNRECGNAAGVPLARLLADPSTLVVVTGQQPNLLASPMYVLLKAVTAWALARRLSAASGRTVVPVFWVASDDHDFHELRQCRVWSPTRGLSDIGALVSRGGAPEGSPAFAWRLGESADRVRGALARAVPEALANPATREAVEEALLGDPDFEAAFCRMTARLLAGVPMLFLAPRLGVMRRRQVDVLKREIAAAGETNRSVNAAAGALEDLGYRARLHRPVDALNLFVMHEGVRCRVLARGSGYHVVPPDGHTAVATFADAGALTAELELRPERFSPNVVTRPVVQDAALPTVAYVGGPGEIAYLAQTRGAYRILGVEPSAVVPRASATLLDVEAAALLGDAAGASALDEALTRLVAGDPELAPVAEQRRHLEASVVTGLDGLEALDAMSHPHLRTAFDKTRHGVERSLRRFDERLRRHFVTHGSGAAWQRFVRVSGLVRPGGAPQERALSPLSFCASMSPEDLGAWLAGNVASDASQHQVLRLP